jgi:adenosine kinase
VANLAAANHYKKDHFETEEVQAWINKAKFFYCSSFFLTVSPETVVEIGKHAHANDKHLTINLAAPFLIDFFFDQLSSVMPYADIIVGNEHEGLTIGRKLGWGVSNILPLKQEKMLFFFLFFLV